MKYVLLEDYRADNLAKNVQDKLDAGWQLSGAPFEFDGGIVQAMIYVDKND